MNFISICSGIEAASAAFHPLGWTPIAFSEIEPFPCAVLDRHYPLVPNLGDMKKFRDWPEEIFANADVLVGGPPCQAFSRAGARNGLDDARGNLTLTYAELINHADAVRINSGKSPAIIVYENVPGILSDRTNGFGHLLGALAGHGAPIPVPPGHKRWSNAGVVAGPQRTLAWRVLDAQYFGVPQRRRRVFLVGCSAGSGRDPSEILFERQGVQGNIAAGRKKGTPVAALTANGVGTCGADDNQSQAGHLIPVVCGGIVERAFSFALRGRDGGALPEIHKDGQSIGSLRASGGGSSRDYIAFGGNNTSGPIDIATAVNACASASGRMDFESETFVVEPAGCKPAANGSMAPVALLVPIAGETQWMVRRLTPIECARLQGFPDHHLDIAYRNKPAADGPKYKALGNSMAVPVMRWIGKRIAS